MMMQKLVIRLCGNAVDVSVDGVSGFPEWLKVPVEQALTYKYFKLLRGQEAYEASTGRRKPSRVEYRYLYAYDKYGRMVFGAGLLPRIKTQLEALGCDVVALDVNPPHPRPDRFKEDWDNVLRNFEFRAKQESCLLSVSSNDRGIIEAPTGFGKSFLYAAIGLLYPKANIAIITKRMDLVEGTRNHVLKYLPNIGQIGGGVKRRGRVTICSADSMHHLDADSCDIVVGEEAHELVAPSYSRGLAGFRFARMFGFTATPSGRIDNADKKLESLFGPIIFRMSYQEAVQYGLVVPIHVKWISCFMDTNPCQGLVEVPRVRWGIWRNARRNQIIAEEANKFGPDEQVLIMVTTYDHAVHLRQYLPDFTLCHAERKDDDAFDRFVKKGMLPEDEPVMTSARRSLLRTQFETGELKKVIATDVWSTGVSFNALSVLIRADARGSTILDSQIPGRVCRLHAESDKQRGLVLDMIDEFDPGFREAARKRKRNYDTKGWTQEGLEVGGRRRLMAD
jgi:hypothetical protein